jgi:flagellar basal body rod protein FlgG
VTGHPLHVSLPELETHLFFELENGQLTRRGDFCRLSGGRLGLVTPSGELPLRGSPVVDTSSGTVRIMSHGEIYLLVDTESSASDGSSRGDVQGIGQVPVVAITDLSQLTSVDGVFFTSHEPGRHPDPMTIEMRPGCLELSNVDADAEIQQLRAWRTTAAP